MASTRITLSVDKDRYRAAREAAAHMGTTVSRMTDLFFGSLAAGRTAKGASKVGRLRGAFRSEGANERRSLLSGLRAKHLP